VKLQDDGFFLVDRDNRIRVEISRVVKALVKQHAAAGPGDRMRIEDEIWTSSLKQDPIIRMMWTRPEWLSGLGIHESHPHQEAPIPAIPRSPKDSVLWSKISADVSALVAEKIADPLLLEEATTWFKVEFDGLVRSLTHRLGRIGQGKTKVEVNRIQYTTACRILHVDPAGVGKSIDVAEAKVAKKKLLRAYHPDLNNGDITMQHLCDSIMDAFDIIESYADQMQKISKKTDKHNVEVT
jgi:hypothetical protein